MKTEKFSVICICILFVILIIFFVGCTIGVATIEKYPHKEELTYEECTYISYKFMNGKHKRYCIYVSEYEEPLVIDTVVYSKVNKEVLAALKSGDTIKVSIVKNKSNMNLYSMSCEGKEVLSYENYLKQHEQNNKLGLVLLPIISCLSLTGAIVAIVYYKKTGHCI